MTASVSIDPAVRREVQSDYFRYLLPTLIGQIAHSFYCMADVFFVGAAVGSDGLAALNVALPVFTLFSAFSLMVGVGTATTASILTGQGQTQQTNRVFTQSMVLLAVVGLTLTLLTSVFIVPLARVFGATDRILTEVVDYMRPINLLAFAYIFSGALGVIIRADGNPRLVMIAGTTGNICNIVLDYVFTMKLGMGMFGAGLATILGHCVAVLLYLLHFALHQNHLHLTRNFFDPAACVRVLRNGIGSSILELSAGLIVLLFNIALLRVSGEAAVAIFSVLSNIAYVGKGVFNGMAQAAQPILSTSYGAGRYDRVRAANPLRHDCRRHFLHHDLSDPGALRRLHHAGVCGALPGAHGNPGHAALLPGLPLHRPQHRDDVRLPVAGKGALHLGDRRAPGRGAHLRRPDALLGALG